MIVFILLSEQMLNLSSWKTRKCHGKGHVTNEPWIIFQNLNEQILPPKCFFAAHTIPLNRISVEYL